MNDKELKGLISQGHILCRVIFEMAGNPKEHVEKTLREYIKIVKEDPDYIFTNEYYAQAEENDGIWSTFYESEIIIASLEKLNVLCFNLSPASVEIIQPDSITLTDKKLTHVYNDVISKIHEIGANLKNVNSENELLKINLNMAIKNCIVLALNEPKTSKEISEKTGIDTEHLNTFLETMLKDKSLVKDGEKYHKKS